ncbi:MAG: hypothetical protein P8M20_08480, partial [Planctomycetaceae bacterium]|nr:hypothetical protein [Planctomycetaceae bacterium]
MESSSKIIRDLKVEHFQHGRVEWVGLCTARRGVVEIVSEVSFEVGAGLVGDHHATSGKSERQVTVIEQEHLATVVAMVGHNEVRRILVVSGINLIALKNQTFHIGDVGLEGSGPCVPCLRMCEVLGPDGYNAMRGHGRITVRVLHAGTIRVGDDIVPITGPIEHADQAHCQTKIIFLNNRESGPVGDPSSSKNKKKTYIAAYCKVCNTRVTPKAMFAGRRIKCPDCFTSIQIPTLEEHRAQQEAAKLKEPVQPEEHKPYSLNATIEGPELPPVRIFEEQAKIRYVRKRPKPPEYPFLSNVFQFPWSDAGTLARWGMISVGLAINGAIMAINF